MFTSLIALTRIKTGILFALDSNQSFMRFRVDTFPFMGWQLSKSLLALSDGKKRFLPSGAVIRSFFVFARQTQGRWVE
jgi:hypothetical protein